MARIPPLGAHARSAFRSGPASRTPKKSKKMGAAPRAGTSRGAVTPAAEKRHQQGQHEKFAVEKGARREQKRQQQSARGAGTGGSEEDG